MPSPRLTGAHYITNIFRAYCKRHAVNPVPPFALYMDFLTHAKEKGRYGWMRLAKDNRDQLLEVAYTVMVGIYGRTTMQNTIKRQRTARGGEAG